MPDSTLIFTAPIINGSGALSGQNCSVELLGLAIYGDMRHGWELPCIDAGAQSATVTVNDRTSEAVKQTRAWRLLLARLGTCHNTGNARVQRRMALWAARSVEHLSLDPRVQACNDTLEAYLNGEATLEELQEASTTATHAAHAAADAARHAAALSAAATTTAAAAATANATDSDAERDEALLDWLDRYLTAWGKVAADEGCLLPENQEDEYVAFVESLDFLTGRDE